MIGLNLNPLRLEVKRINNLDIRPSVNLKTLNGDTFQKTISFQSNNILENSFEITPELENLQLKINKENARAIIDPLCKRPICPRGFRPDPEIVQIFNKIIHGNYSAIEDFQKHKMSKLYRTFFLENLIISLQESIVANPTKGKAIAMIKLDLPEKLTKIRFKAYSAQDDGKYAAANLLLTVIMTELEKQSDSDNKTLYLEEAKAQIEKALSEINRPSLI